jgi:pyrimidine deaminase RibD-like protein/8-oxo-dGTP pyrophosphatase MutT (NUDIX family)
MDENDLKAIEKAIEEAAKSESEDEQDPRVGAVVFKEGKCVEVAHRGETGKGHHAEFVLLQKKVRTSDILDGATLYTTLEPCTMRRHDKLPCVEWILRKRIGRVVIGILDPNPNICGRGYWRLMDANIPVEFFPPSLVKKVIAINQPFIQLHRGSVEYDALFPWTMERNKSPTVAPYPGIGWGDTLSLQDCPSMREGWPVTQIELHHDDNRPFQLPDIYCESYKDYVERHWKTKRFYDDGEKFMVTHNPTAFSDAPTLKLQTIKCRYSQVRFYNDNVATIAAKRTPLIDELVKGSLEVRFAHSLCMHFVVVTSDDKVLVTKRSPKVEWDPNTWACSFEEQLARRDLVADPNSIIQEWAKRALKEELGLDAKAYELDNLRVLSVFLESDILGVSLCTYVELSVDSGTLNTVLRGLPRTDYEFTEWQFLEFKPIELLSELMRPTLSPHPSSGYRMLMALLKRFGVNELQRALRQL